MTRPSQRPRVGSLLAALAALLAAACQRTEPAAAPAITANAPATPATARASKTAHGAVQTAATDATLIERGRYLALLGNCAGCHTARGGADYAGGEALHTPFGKVYGGNLTPDISTGLGAWTAQDFWQALHKGRTRDGRALAPAFPYTAFTHIPREDSDALFAFLRSLAPVQQANQAHALRFPFGTQWALSVWQWLYFEPASLATATRQQGAPTPSQARGAALFNGLGHCAACHASRNVWGALGPQATGAELPGPGWYAPSLHPVVGRPTPVEDWITLLRTGQTSHRTVLGPMAGVVFKSTQHWQEADVRAVVEHLATLPPTAPAPQAAPAPAAVMALGRTLYKDRCADCHGSQGEGVPGAYPALANNSSVAQPNIRNLVQVLRHGGFAPTTAGNPRPYGMPPQRLSDTETAAVLSFVRQSFGHQAAAVTELDVLKLR
jgi:mono/diheme cytochrome c family protein